MVRARNVGIESMRQYRRQSWDFGGIVAQRADFASL
jgi:hypothetical protein